MAKTKRNYKAEYAKRIHTRLKQGYSRAQARGHARKHEVPISTLKKKCIAKSTTPKSVKKYYSALKKIQRGASLTKASKAVRLSPATLHKIDLEREALKKEPTTGRYVVKAWAEWDVFTPTGQHFRDVRFDRLNASDMGRYWNAQESALKNSNANALTPFRRLSVVDIEGNRYRLMTDINDIRGMFDQMSEGERDNFNEKLYRPLRHAA